LAGKGQSEKKLCFVIGPIGDPGSDTRRHADWVLCGIIKPVFKEHYPDFIVERADEIVTPGSINSQVINRLMNARLVIADMSFHNANAFYELAVRHMKVLPTIHLTHKDWKIPFDVAPYRAITFDYTNHSDLEKAQDDLRTSIAEVLKPDFRVENPITNARGRAELDEHATPALRLLADAVDALQSKVSELAAQQRVAAERDALVRSLLVGPQSGVANRAITETVGLGTPVVLLAGTNPILDRTPTGYTPRNHKPTDTESPEGLPTENNDGSFEDAGAKG
jgi:hypothetical protein